MSTSLSSGRAFRAARGVPSWPDSRSGRLLPWRGGPYLCIKCWCFTPVMVFEYLHFIHLFLYFSLRYTCALPVTHMVKLIILQKQKEYYWRFGISAGTNSCLAGTGSDGCFGKLPIFGRGGDGFCAIISDGPTRNLKVIYQDSPAPCRGGGLFFAPSRFLVISPEVTYRSSTNFQYPPNNQFETSWP